MRTRIRGRWPVFELFMIVLVAVVGWAAFRSWEVMREFEDGQRIERRAEALQMAERRREDDSKLLLLYEIRDDYLNFQRQVQPAIEEMRLSLRRYVHEGNSNDWKIFEWSRRPLQAWMERMDQRVRRRNLSDLQRWLDKRSGEEIDDFDEVSLNVGELLQRFDKTYQKYLATANSIERLLRAPARPAPQTRLPPKAADTVASARDPETSKRREAATQQLEAAEAQANELLLLVDEAHRESTMIQWLIQLQPIEEPIAVVASAQLGHFQSRFLPVLYTLSAGLIGLCVVSGVAIYRRLFVAPLHLKLVERETILEQQQKFAHFEKLAALLAHEIKQPLAAINAWVWVLQRSLAEGTAEHKGAVLIRNEMNRIDSIMKDFLKLSQPMDPKPVSMRADQPLREVVELLGPKLEDNSIKIHIDSVVDARFRADPQQLKQVLLNLVQNAAEAIGRDGEITLRARRDRIILRGEKTDVVVLEIEDNGPGIPVEVQERLFDPFYSTKENGTGLGLAIAAKIVDKHEGALIFESKEGHGTTFGIVLPAEKA